MTATAAPKSATVPTGWHTRCLARYVIQLPPQATPRRDNGVVYHDTQIHVLRGSAIEKRADRLDRKVRYYRRQAGPRAHAAFAARQALGSGDTLVWYWTLEGTPKRIEYAVFARRPHPGLVYELHAKRPAGDRTGTMADLRSLAESIVPRAPGQIPDELGFCLPGGFIPDDGVADGFERAGAVYEAGRGDRRLKIKVHPSSSAVREDLRNNPTVRLFQEQKELGVPVIRFRARDLAGIKGAEYVLHHEDPPFYEMHWRTRPRPDAPGQVPDLNITLGAGDGYSRDEALALWDGLLAGFRPCKACRGSRAQ